MKRITSKTSKVTVRDAMHAIWRAHGGTHGYSVEVRGNGALWIYVATDDAGRPMAHDRDALSKIRRMISEIAGFYPVIVTGASVDGEALNMTRYPRIEIHPSMVAEVL